MFTIVACIACYYWVWCIYQSNIYNCAGCPKDAGSHSIYIGKYSSLEVSLTVLLPPFVGESLGVGDLFFCELGREGVSLLSHAVAEFFAAAFMYQSKLTLFKLSCAS